MNRTPTPSRAPAVTANDIRDTQIWVAGIPDIFGGYGLIAIGHTEEEARKALWDIYLTRSADWNSNSRRGHDSLDSLIDHWGIHMSLLNIGQGYFGDDDERTTINPDKLQPVEGDEY